MAGIQSSDDRKIQRVPPLLVVEEKNKNDYYPKVVSIGPYHHGKPELASVEAFKPIALDWFVSDKGKEFYYTSIFKIITDIQNCYERDPSIKKYLDVDGAACLAEMMLRDAALIIIYMEIYVPAQSKFPALMGHLGMLTLTIFLSDLLLLENQIPLRVVKLLITLKYGAGEDEKLLHRFMNTSIYGENRPIRKETKKRGEPLHLLEAFHRLVASDCAKNPKRACFKCRWFCCCFTAAPTGGGAAPGCFSCTFLCCSGDKGSDPESGSTNANAEAAGWIHRLVKSVGCKKLQANKKTTMKNHIKSFRSVTDLMARGIHFRPSSTQSLKDVSFKSRFFYATLELPEWSVSIYTKVFFLNLVAFELSPNSRTAMEVVSYINFMKSLIQRPEDVKELRERQIFFNMLGSDEEVLHVLKDINTYGAYNRKHFNDVEVQIQNEIQAHFNSRVKTWIAELIHTNFRSPWTITTFLAAVALLVISAAQLYYAVHPN